MFKDALASEKKIGLWHFPIKHISNSQDGIIRESLHHGVLETVTPVYLNKEWKYADLNWIQRLIKKLYT